MCPGTSCSRPACSHFSFRPLLGQRAFSQPHIMLQGPPLLTWRQDGAARYMRASPISLKTAAQAYSGVWPRSDWSLLGESPRLASSDLDRLCPPPSCDDHVIQHVLESKEKRSCKHALAYFRSNSCVRHISQQNVVRSLHGQKQLTHLYKARRLPPP